MSARRGASLDEPRAPSDDAAVAVVVISGANRGIGLALIGSYLRRGDDVVAACRRSSPELESLAAEYPRLVIQAGVDVTQDDAVAQFAKTLTAAKVDILINNAGLLERHDLGSGVLDSIRRQFDVNTLGPLRITAALLPRLGQGSRVVIISSRMGSIEDNTSGGSYGYRISKAAVNMLGRTLANDLRGRRIAVGLLHPGFVQTGMTGGKGKIVPEQSAELLVQRIDELDLDSSGSFRHADGSAIPW